MIKKVQYTDQEDRTIKIEENKNMFFVGEQNITEGNFLLFSDTPPQPPTEVIEITINESDWKELKQKQELMQKAIDGLILGGVV
ncbi:hypothetical protein [Clostridium sp. DJ247]|uniref:hypothetical protein n=1 Tax=Clostridium sp. DJ247 TaxID=2726188 RepID=UPI0016248966|nr:hypothetical protein [Clostridium sp. DJ247]MBC2579683.1 hypothetical protein [Clostridium sp. DJ247]